MKKVFLIVLVLFSMVDCIAQETIAPIENQVDYYSLPLETIVYYKDVNNLLDKYEGNWVLNDGTHYLEINITKHEHIAKGAPGLYNDNDYKDEIIVTITNYKLNGVIKYQNEAGIGGNYIIDNNTVKLFYGEPSLTSCYRQKIGDLTLEFVAGGANGNDQLIWTRENNSIVEEGSSTCPDGTAYDTSDFLIPANLVLTKE